MSDAVYEAVYEDEEEKTRFGPPEHALEKMPTEVRERIEDRLTAIEEFKNNPELAQERRNDPLEDKVFVRGEKIKFDVPPVIEHGRTLIPVRAVTESLGATVEWDDEKKEVKIEKDDITIEMILGEKTVTVDDQEMKLEVPGNTRNGRTLVPLRFISEILGDDVTYHNDTGEIDIGELRWATELESSDDE